MGILLTASVLFLLTLLVPGFASDEADDERRAIDNLRRNATALKAQVDALRAEQAQMEASNAPLKERVAIQRELEETTIKSHMAVQRLAMENKQSATAAAAAAKEYRKLARSLKDLHKGFSAADRVAKELVGDLGGLLGVSSELGNSIIGSFVQAIQKGETFGDVLKNVTVRMKETFSATNITVSIINKLVEATLAVAAAQDQAISSFIRATGATQGYDQVMEGVFSRTRQVGVSMQEAGQAVTALYTQMASYSTLNNTLQGQLAQQVALMSEIGISVESTARAFDTLTKVMGQTPREAARISEEMVQMAENIGIPPARMMQELSATAPQLAQWGDQMMQVFVELEQAAKATGVALSSLVSIASQFDTFYGAAEAAGRLNAMLGGPYLNAIELLNANEQERIRLMIQSLELSGRSWSSMGRFERQAVATAAGISDMADASRIFGQSLSQYDAAQRAVERNAAAQQELAARAAEAQTVFEMLKNIVNSFAITMRPVVEVVRDVMLWVSKMADALSENKFVRILAGATLAVGALSAAIGIAGAALGSLLTPVGMAVAAVGGLAALFTMGHSPTFPEYIGIAAVNMGNLARSAREALPSVRALNQEMSMTAAAMAATATASTNAKLRATAGGLSVVRVEESAELKNIFYRLLQSNEHYANRLESFASKDVVLHMDNREMGRATRGIVNREMRTAGKSF